MLDDYVTVFLPAYFKFLGGAFIHSGYTMKRWLESNTALFCFLIGLLCAFPLIFLTPPFQVPDEPQHFFRAYQVSEGNFKAEARDGKAGGDLPSSLVVLSSSFLGTRSIHANRPIVKKSWASVSGAMQLPLKPDVREFIDFSGAAFYSPIPYFPQSLAISVGRAFQVGPLGLMYLARFANATFALLIVSLGIALAPLAKSTFLAVALFPMSLYLFASSSPDALVIASAFLFTAISLRSYLEKHWSARNIALAICCATIFCSIKIVYAPLIFIALGASVDRLNWRKQVLFRILLVVIPISITLYWLGTTAKLVVPVKTGTDIGAQISFVATNPMFFLAAVRHSLLWNGFYFSSTIGILGWLTLKLPALSYILASGILFLSMFSDSLSTIPRSKILRLWWLALSCGCVFLIMLALYIYWTQVGGAVVEGVQGRYFLPFLPLFVIAMMGVVSKLKFLIVRLNVLVWVAGIGLINACVTFYALCSAFWIFSLTP